MIQLQTFSSLASISLTDSESAASRVIVRLARIEEFAQNTSALTTDDAARLYVVDRLANTFYLMLGFFVYLCTIVMGSLQNAGRVLFTSNNWFELVWRKRWQKFIDFSKHHGGGGSTR